MAFDASLLDEFSGAFAKSLFAEHPDWVSFARVEMADDGETPDLVVEVPPPHPEKGISKLIVHTEDFEVTVNFDWYHNHFSWPASDMAGSINPLTFIAEILKEDVAVASAWRHDKWAGSWAVRKGEPVVDLANLGLFDRIRVRSWKGTFNQDLPFPDRESLSDSAAKST
jgi:hypothetical protein